MSEQNSTAVGVLDTHEAAERAVNDLKNAGFDMKMLSIIGREYHTEETIVGYYNTGDRMAAWGKYGLFWGSIWGLVFGSAFFFIPGIGAVMVGGPLVSWMLGALEAAVVAGGLSAIGGALSGIGIPDDSILLYETALKADKFVLIVHGNAADVERARTILANHQADDARTYPHVVKDQPAHAAA